MLDICRSFFARLNASGIRYCHWKSNIRLKEALAGKTDLDILVHESDRDAFESVLDTYRFKKILSPAEKTFPGMEDYIGFDDRTGRLIHLHLHYKLVVGPQQLKNYHLPIEAVVFDNLILANGIPVPCPEMELILLVIRAHMKLDVASMLKHIVKDIMHRPYVPFPSDIEKELTVLVARADYGKLNDILIRSGLPLSGDIFTGFMKAFSQRGLRARYVIETRALIFSTLKDFRYSKGMSIYLKYVYRTFRNMPLLRNAYTQRKKILPGTGKIFSLVGADGSGKTTLLADLVGWLSWKLSVDKVYYGIPKSPIVKFLTLMTRFFRKIRFNVLVEIINGCFWVYVAWKRKKVYRKTLLGRKGGRIIITDRFPLKTFYSMREPMDGPRLMWEEHKALSRFSKIEAGYYKEIQMPDMVFVLQVPLDELRNRKKDITVEEHKKKSEAVNKVEASSAVCLVDADRPYSDVLLEIKRKIWASL